MRTRGREIEFRTLINTRSQYFGIRRHRSEISWARRFKSVPFNQYGGQRYNKLASDTEQITRKQRHSSTSDAIS